ncbi:MAG: dihydrolipoyl dehydrogenase [Myxococcales bacterium]|nr:dihydrolipoyl dehydrogenase [Myxococcales bacterium]
MSNYDLVVIGSGPGGYVAAIRASQLGLKTALVEKDATLGGTCLNRGCIPAKALLHSAEVLHEAQNGAQIGVDVSSAKIDMDGLQTYRAGIVDELTGGIAYLMKKNKITVERGFGQLLAADKVKVSDEAEGERILSAKHVLLATGSTVKGLPGLELDGKNIISSDEILELTAVPKTLLVVGAGAVGTEFASAYADYGSEVTLVEFADRLLPIEDADCSKELAKAFKKRGIKVMTSHKVNGSKVSRNKVTVEIESLKKGEKTEAKFDKVLVAAGRAPCTKNLGLEALGIKVNERGLVEVDANCHTGVGGVYAIGDIIPTAWLAHVASAEAFVAVEHMAGLNPKPVNHDRIPSCTYCRPEVASVGLTEAAAKERGYTVKVSKFPFSAIGKAKILKDTGGFVKIVAAEEYDEVLGVHIVGPRATEAIAEACVALSAEATSEWYASIMHAHPTLSETVQESLHSLMGHPVHM